MTDEEFIGKNKKQIRPVKKGFLFMIIACLVYLLWWFLNYYPESPFSNFIGNPIGMAIWGSMFLAVFVLCLAGVILILRGFRRLYTDRIKMNVRTATIICLAASVALPLLISRLRFITLDIFLIIWWAYLELCTANMLFGSHLMNRKKARISFVRTYVYTGISLVLYIVYPLPPAHIRFILGAVPIILYTVDMSWMAFEMGKSEAKGSASR